MSNLHDFSLLLLCRAQNALHRLKRRIQDENGATTVEYALLIAVIVVGVIAAATYMFDPLKDFFKEVVKKVKDMIGKK
jgi:Flp pilus assembly pilin Flp